jgi:hypothetical protein
MLWHTSLVQGSSLQEVQTLKRELDRIKGSKVIVVTHVSLASISY